MPGGGRGVDTGPENGLGFEDPFGKPFKNLEPIRNGGIMPSDWLSSALDLAQELGGLIRSAITPGIDGAMRRRRRRRALTASDRADIAFITATLGAPAGKSFAMIIAART